MATGASRLGPKPPEVTRPTSAPSSAPKSSVPARIGARPSGSSPTRRRAAPAAICPRITSAPGNPPARAPPARRAGWIAHSSAASTGVVVRSMSLP